METEISQLKIDTEVANIRKIHERHLAKLVGYAPVVFFGFLLIGYLLDLKYPRHLLPEMTGSYLGLGLVFLGTVFVFFAQKSKREAGQKDFMAEEKLRFGPYKNTRNPTYLGLLIVGLGFAFVANALALLLATICAFIFFEILLRREERVLETLHGESYKNYKSSVRRWL